MEQVKNTEIAEEITEKTAETEEARMEITEKTAETEEARIEITSVSDFIKEVNKTSDHESAIKKRLYRGLRDSQWTIKSSLELNMGAPPADEHSVIREYIHNQALIDHAKYHDFDKAQNESSKTHLGSLAHMRHYGAATSLVDFTGEPLVALCFACQPNKEAKEETDGVVYSLDIKQDDQEFIEITKDEHLREWTIDKILKVTDKCFYWKPPSINKRISVQDSYFIIGSKKFYNYPSERISRIIIPHSRKQEILRELSEKHNISIDKFFDDMEGFAQLNSYGSNYVSIPLEQRAENYLTSSIDMIENEEKSSKILGDNPSKEKYKNKELFNLYNERGIINLKNGEYRESIKKDRIAKKRYQKAIDDFTKAIEIYEKAIKEYKKDNKNASETKIEIDDDYAELYYNRGYVQLQLEEYQEAIKDFKKTLKIRGNHAKALNSIGLAEFELGKPKTAVRYYTEAIATDKKFAEAYFNRGIVRSLQKKEKLAIDDFTKAIETEPDYAEAYNACGVIQSKLGNHQKALNHFNQAIKIKPEYLEAIVNRGLANQNLRKYQKAREDFTEATQINAEHAVSYYNRGIARDLIGDYEKAIEDYNKVLELEPDNADARNKRGIANIRLQRYDEAVRDFTKATEIDHKYADAYNNRGFVSATQRDYQRAIKDFTKAIEIDPSNASAYCNRGLAIEYLAKDNKGIEKAIEDYKKAISINEEYLDALRGLGLAKAKLNEYQEAIEYFDKVIRLKPDYIQVYNDRASSNVGLGHENKAIKDLKTITEIIPQDPWGYYALGRLKYKLGSHKEALEMLSVAKHLIHVHNRSSEYKEILEEIEQIISTINVSPKQ